MGPGFIEDIRLQQPTMFYPDYLVFITSSYGFQDCLNQAGGGFLGAIADVGVVDTMVATLQHDSPFCVSAAAGALWRVSRNPGGGKALIEASGAVAALVHVIKRAPAPANLEMETGVFRTYGPGPNSSLCLCAFVMLMYLMYILLHVHLSIVALVCQCLCPPVMSVCL
jgi:hypothetical protein